MSKRVRLFGREVSGRRLYGSLLVLAAAWWLGAWWLRRLPADRLIDLPFDADILGIYNGYAYAASLNEARTAMTISGYPLAGGTPRKILERTMPAGGRIGMIRFNSSGIYFFEGLLSGRSRPGLLSGDAAVLPTPFNPQLLEQKRSPRLMPGYFPKQAKRLPIAAVSTERADTEWRSGAIYRASFDGERLDRLIPNVRAGSFAVVAGHIYWIDARPDVVTLFPGNPTRRSTLTASSRLMDFPLDTKESRSVSQGLSCRATLQASDHAVWWVAPSSGILHAYDLYAYGPSYRAPIKYAARTNGEAPLEANGRLLWLEDGYTPRATSGRTAEQVDRSVRRLVSESPNGSDRRPILTLEENGRKVIDLGFLGSYNGRVFCSFQPVGNPHYWDDTPRESFGEIDESSTEKLRRLMDLPRGASPIVIRDGALYFEIEETDSGWWRFSHGPPKRVLYKFKLG